jgi:hypothetical protein
MWVKSYGTRWIRGIRGIERSSRDVRGMKVVRIGEQRKGDEK